MSQVKVKGTYDILPNDAAKWQALESYVRTLFKKFNYQEIRTPIMEYSSVFHRENEHSDMVTKETYNFFDKSERSLTLRPEGTAGVVRSYIENKLYANQDLSKLYYIGPSFRYERPQKGRFRQFMQLGVEALGSNNPLLDAEVISMAYETIKGLGLKDVVVKINSLGDDEAKKNYQQVLYDYLLPFKSQLSPDSQTRLEKNTLRVLDSKAETDQAIIKNAPLPLDHLNIESSANFNAVTDALDAAKVAYEIDKKLVRGLDYYSHTVFEIQANIPGFGAQNALGGGGRYQNLVKELGGPSVPGVGYAFGMERLLDALEMEGIHLAGSQPLDAYFITFNQEAKAVAFALQSKLRSEGLSSDLNYTDKSFKGQLKEALAYQARFLLILGEDELKKKVINIKNTETEVQITESIETFAEKLKELLHHA